MESKKHFTDHEIAHLRTLVFKYQDIVENKRNDCQSLADKKQCWQRISNEYNEKHPINRTAAQLKKCWENLKFRKKVEIAKAKCERVFSEGVSFVPTITPTTDPELDPMGTVKCEINVPVETNTVHFMASDHGTDHFMTNNHSTDNFITNDLSTDHFIANDRDTIDPMNHARQLYEYKVREHLLAIQVLEEKIKQNNILFNLKKRKLELEIEKLEQT